MQPYPYPCWQDRAGPLTARPWVCRATLSLPLQLLPMASLHEQVAASVQADIDACRVTRVFAPADPPDELLPAVASVADAYQAQAAAARLRKARGEELAGFKIGCTSAAVQKAFGVSERALHLPAGLVTPCQQAPLPPPPPVPLQRCGATSGGASAARAARR